MQSSVHQTEVLLFFTLLQLSVIVVVARLAGEMAVRLSQSRAVGEIVAGLMLGPSLFGLLLPGIFKYVFRSAAAEPMTTPALKIWLKPGKHPGQEEVSHT